MTKILIIAAYLLITTALFAQEKKTNKSTIQFNSFNQVGLLNGDAGASYDVQSINGISKGKWGVGIGVAIDNYINRSVPVFLNVRRELTNNINRPFIYAGSGLNYNWLTGFQKEGKGLPYSTTPGLFFDAGIGYKIQSKNRVGFVMSAGYSYKQSKELVGSQSWGMPWPMPGQTQNLEKINSQFRRIVIRVGIDL